MLIMFAVGVMNLAGMAFVTLIVCAEKLIPLNAKRVTDTADVVFLIRGLAFWLR